VRRRRRSKGMFRRGELEVVGWVGLVDVVVGSRGMVSREDVDVVEAIVYMGCIVGSRNGKVGDLCVRCGYARVYDLRFCPIFRCIFDDT